MELDVHATMERITLLGETIGGARRGTLQGKGVVAGLGKVLRPQTDANRTEICVHLRSQQGIEGLRVVIVLVPIGLSLGIEP